MERIPQVLADVIHRHFAEPVPTSSTDTANAHRAGLAAATSSVISTIHEIDGDWIERSMASEIARKAIASYLTQIERITRDGGRS